MEPSNSDSFNGTNPGGVNSGNFGGVGIEPRNVGNAGMESGNMQNQMGQMPQMNSGGMNAIPQMDSRGMNAIPQMGVGNIEMGMAMQTNPGGMNMMAQANPGGVTGSNIPSSSGTGDVILGEQKKKSSKLGAIIIGLLIFCVGLVAILLAISNSGSNREVSVSETVNHYLTQFFYGDTPIEFISGEKTIESVERFGGSNIATYYKREGTSLEDDIAYYNVLKNDLESILGAVKDNSEYEELGAYVGGSRELLKYYFAANALLYNNESDTYYLTNGSLDGFLNKFDYPAEVSEDNALFPYWYQIAVVYDDLREYYAVFATNECVDNTDGNMVCSKQKEINELASSVSGSSATLEYMAANMLKSLVYSANLIDGLGNGGEGE
ncbi:hypothetical protein IKD98_01975 [Candidatus Saccharibacteria bacterium]|nr:hypothetical protein [Candidatus Saccharibacteria bacterium]